VTPRPGTPEIVLVGVGAATALGATADATGAATRAGIAGFTDHPFMRDARGDPFVVAMADWIAPGMQATARMRELVRQAAREAAEHVPAARGAPRARLAAFVGLPESRPGLDGSLADAITATLGDTLGPHLAAADVHLLPAGHASGLLAMAAAARLLHQGGVEFALAGGVDSQIDADTLEWLDRCNRLHVPTNGWGYIPGEAAALCLLCTARTAERHGLEPLGRMGAFGAAQEPNRIYTETICLGRGLTQAVRQTLDAMPAGVTVDATICDQNGEAYRADECGFMLARTSERFVAPTEFVAPADCWGDVGAASGPLFVLLAARAANMGYATGCRTLLWASSEGGARGAALFESECRRDARP
jgi:3-oxoacyl-[acyl-carrier-protein] synthase I